jgi:hypothetical protein
MLDMNGEAAVSPRIPKNYLQFYPSPPGGATVFRREVLYGCGAEPERLGRLSLRKKKEPAFFRLP